MKHAMDYIAELKVGSEILVGRFKNKRVRIKAFGVDDKGHPVVETNKGTYKIFTFRVEAPVPVQKKKKKSQK